MTPQELLTQLMKLNIKLWLDGDQLRFKAPQGAMSPELRMELAKHKTALVARLQNSANANLSNMNLQEITPVVRSAQLPLSFAQQRLWFLDQFEPNSASYNIPSAIRLSGDLNETALRRTLNEIVRRHEVLRTTFALQDGAPVQIIADQLALSLPVTDLTGLPTAERETHALQLAQDESQTPFDLSTGPLIRAGLIRLGTTEHVLLFTMHHIISDGWSMGVLVNEVVALYAAYVQDRPSSLAELPIQYADFAHWQRQWLSGNVLQQQLDYWTEQLSGSPTLLTLPTDHPRPAVQSYSGATHAFEISAQTTVGLYALNKQTQTTLFMTLLAAFNILLARYSGQDDICIGTSIANRSRAEIEGLIGFFVNTLVLRTQVDSAVSFEQLLQQVRTSTLNAYAHQDVPFEQLVEVLKPERHTSHSPLFQVMLELQNTPMDNLELPGLTLQLLSTDIVTAKFDLTLGVTESDGQLVASFEYNTDLFDPATIERMAGHFTRLLDEIVAYPNVPIQNLHMLGTDELHQLLVEWNQTETAYPLDQCIHQLFEEQAQKTPDAIAAECEDQRLSYLELNQQANLLAFHLAKNTVGPEKLVAFYLERDLHFLIAMLAVFKAGAAYLPLDLHYPTDRLTKILKTSQANIILVNRQDYANLSQHLSSLPEATRPQIMIIEDILEKNEKHSNPNIYVESSYLAYVIYTSGSTGMPKGAMVEHRGMLNHLYATITEISLTSSDVVAQTASQHFDISVWQFLAALMVGGRTQIFKQEVVLDPAKLVHGMATAGVTVWEAVPSFIKAVLDLQHESRNLTGEPALECLRWLIATGEDLPPTLSQLWLNDYPDVPILNAYGPAECSDDVTFHRIAHLESINYSHTPVGRPIANLQIYILDQWLQPVPVGVNGEIYIGGVGVGRGYLRDPKRTADVFLPDPFSIDPGARLYKSGDLGRYLPTGEIEFLGRVDFQVKIRGLRLELGEIEVALAALLEVRQAVVLACEDTIGDPLGGAGKHLVAYLVMQPGCSLPETAELRSKLSQSLTDYMLPAYFVQIEQFPLTRNGKLDRKALPVPDMTRNEVSYVAPRTATEATLAHIWAEVLKLDRVSIHDNFFELGGHSLLAITLIERMRQVGLSADIRALFSSPTIAALAVAANMGGSEIVVPPNLIPADCQFITPEMLPLVQLTPNEIAQIVKTVPGGAANIQDIYPLAPSQEGLLFHHLVSQEGDAYLMPSLLSFESREGLDRFVDALQIVINRHDILRTAVLWEGVAEPVQVVWRQAPVVIEEIRLDPQDGDIEAQLSARFNPRHYRLDVRQAPMLCGFIARDLTNHRWLLQILSHHLVDDHTTLELLTAEIQTLLQGREEELPATLPFRNFVAQAKLGIPQAEHEAFFTEMLSHIDEPTAPFGLLDVQGDGSGIDETRREVDPLLAQRLRRQARRLGIGPASIMHLAWAQVLARTTGRQDIVFGTVLFGRMQGGAGADRVLGMFINTLPICIPVGDLSVQESVRQTHTRLTQLLRHEHASLALAQRCSGVQAPTPLFSTLLNYRHSAGAETIVQGQQNDIQVLSMHERTNYPLILSVDDLREGFALTVQVAASIQAQRICDYMHTTLEYLINALETAPQTPIHQIEVLPVTELHQLLVGWNATETAYPQEQCIHELFEAQVERAPDAVALVFEDHQLTYRELNERANQLAHYLRSQGVGPDVLVGICMERSLEMIVGLLGILKAGGAYVPLDPNYPQDRIHFMIQDAGLSMLLTHRNLASSLSEHVAHAISLDVDWQSLIATQALTSPQIFMHPSNLAYVLFTSGTTGRPKGVALQHRNAFALIQWIKSTYSPDELSGVLASTSIGFDLSVYEIFGTLTLGGCVILVENVLKLSTLTTAENVTLINTVPSAMVELLRQGGLPRSLQTVNLAGEALSAHLVDALYRTGNIRRVIDAYGPTENTTYSTFVVRQAEMTPTIGRPLPDWTVYILDRYFQPVPVGVPGELYIGGAGVARGYLNRPDLTAEKFIPNLFSSVPGARMYRSGDLARYLPDGNIEYLGRIDQQVKIRGFRIELGEIEAALAAIPEVRDVVVLAREDVSGDKRLVAYLVAQAGETILETAELRNKLSQTLPDYMLPAHFVQLKQLPLTPNGKLDRRALPAPDMTRSEAGYVAPRTATEVALAQIWAEVLKLDRVGIHDNFFELGGHSLLAVQLMARIQQTFQYQIPLISLFQNPNLAQFAMLVAEGTTLPWSPLVPIQPRGSRTPLFCIHPAGGLTGVYTDLAHHLGPDQPLYGIQARGCDMRQEPHTSVEEMAACYCDAIQLAQARGPYLLTGWSMGGIVAYEIARQLKQRGEEIAFLGLLDSGVSFDAEEPDEAAILIEFLGLSGQPIDLDETDKDLFPKAFAMAQELALVPRNLPLADFRKYVEVYKTNILAMNTYQPQPYTGTATLFLCQDDRITENTQATITCWRNLVRNLELHDVPGNHQNMIFSPHVAHLASEISNCLDKESESHQPEKKAG